MYRTRTEHELTFWPVLKDMFRYIRRCCNWSKLKFGCFTAYENQFQIDLWREREGTEAIQIHLSSVRLTVSDGADFDPIDAHHFWRRTNFTRSRLSDDVRVDIRCLTRANLNRNKWSLLAFEFQCSWWMLSEKKYSDDSKSKYLFAFFQSIICNDYDSLVYARIY